MSRDGLSNVPKIKLNTPVIALKAENEKLYCVESEAMNGAIYVFESGKMMLATRSNGYLYGDIDKIKTLAAELSEIINELPPDIKRGKRKHIRVKTA